jgi:hypothetical protein
MVGTQAQTRHIVIATTAALTLSAFLLERGVFVVANKETKMPPLNREVSSRIAEINDEFQAGAEFAQIEVLNGFVQRLVRNTKDIDPAVIGAINKDFWGLF